MSPDSLTTVRIPNPSVRVIISMVGAAFCARLEAGAAAHWDTVDDLATTEDLIRTAVLMGHALRVEGFTLHGGICVLPPRELGTTGCFSVGMAVAAAVRAGFNDAAAQA